MKKKARGRPALITAAVVEAVCETMSLGVPESYACALHGVKAETFGPAVSRNAAFRAIKEKCDAQFIARACRAIADGGEIDTLTNAEGETRQVRKPWQGLAWLMERRYWKHFMRKDRHEHTGKDGGPLLTVDEERDIQRVIRKAVEKERE